MANSSYLRSTWNLATKSLADHPWPDFGDYYSDFPTKGTAAEKLECLSRHLREDLAPKDVRANQNLRHERMRADLNKYHDWLLHCLLQKALENTQDKIQRAGTKYILPEDLPKIFDDLYIFHKNHKRLADYTGNATAGTIQHYRTVEQLRDALKPFRPPPHPLSKEDREKAYQTHLKEYQGDGSASLLATLDNGTVVIQLHTEAASRAFGSPHWCTAYRNRKTYFEDYKTDLLVVLEPDGRRFQIHFASNQCKDANDLSVPFRQALGSHSRLEDVLAPYLRRAILQQAYNDANEFNSTVLQLKLCDGHQKFENVIEETRLIQKSLWHAIADNYPASWVTHLINACKDHDRYASFLTAPDGIGSLLNLSILQDDMETSRRIFSTCEKSEQLIGALCEAIPAAVNTSMHRALAKSPNKKSGYGHGTYYFYHELINICRQTPRYAEALLREEALPRALQWAKVRGLDYTIQQIHTDIKSLSIQTGATSENRLAATSRPAPVPQPMV